MNHDLDGLPPQFHEARAQDHEFWMRQEKRIQGATGQPCCTLSGISTGLINLPGNFAVVIHGENECASCFYHFGPSAHQFFCTGLTEEHFVTGNTAGPLKDCLKMVASQLNPEAIFILGACPVEVIGDRFENAVAEVQEQFSRIPMISLHTSGLKTGNQSQMLDWMFSTLASLPVKTPIHPQWRNQMGEMGIRLMNAWSEQDPYGLEAARDAAARTPALPLLDASRCFNLLGLPRLRSSGMLSEMDRILQQVGLHKVGNYPSDCSLDDWQAITFASATFILDRSLYPRLINVLEDAGQDCIEVPLPVGVEQTLAFYRAIGKAFDLEEAIMEAVQPMAEEARKKVNAFKAQYGGKRLAFGMRMNNNYASDQLAHQGLGDYHHMLELGFNPTLLVQGPPEKKERFKRMFETRGIQHDFHMFSEPWTISEHIDGDRYDLAYLADHCRAEARKAGVPLLVNRGLVPFFEGIDYNLRHVEQILLSTEG